MPQSKAPTADQLAHALQVRVAGKAGASGNLSGQVQWLGDDTLWFQPDQHFLALTRYQVVAAPWITGASVSFEFMTGEEVDQGPPELEVDENYVVIDSRPAPAHCGLASGTYLVDMALLINADSVHPVDDTDDGSVEYVAFLSRAQGLLAPRFLARTRRAGQTDDPVLRFTLTPEEVLESVCVVLQAYDGLLRRAKSEPEICFDPVDAAYFHGMCTVALPQSDDSYSRRALPLIFLVALALVLRRSKGRPSKTEVTTCGDKREWTALLAPNRCGPSSRRKRG